MATVFITRDTTTGKLNAATEARIREMGRNAISLQASSWVPDGSDYSSLTSTVDTAPSWGISASTAVGTLLFPGALPADWLTVNIDAFGFGFGASPGFTDLDVELASSKGGDGEDVAASPTNHGAQTVTMPTTPYIMVKTRLVAGLTLDHTRVLRLRLANLGGDYDGGAYQFIGASITKAS